MSKRKSRKVNKEVAGFIRIHKFPVAKKHLDHNVRVGYRYGIDENCEVVNVIDKSSKSVLVIVKQRISD